MSDTDEQILMAREGVYLYNGPIRFLENLLKLMTFRKFKENGVLVLTDRRLVFLRARGFFKDLLAPALQHASHIDERIARQGGMIWPVAEIQTLSTNSGSVGTTPVSSWHIVHQPTGREYTARLFDRASAGEFARKLCATRSTPGLQSPSEAEWRYLGLPVHFGLPATVGKEMEVAYARSVLVIATRQLLAEKPEVAVHDVEKLLLAPAYRDNPAHALFIAVAFYLRGLARLKQNDRTAAQQDLETCVQLAPLYEQARLTLKSLEGAPPRGKI